MKTKFISKIFEEFPEKIIKISKYLISEFIKIGNSVSLIIKEKAELIKLKIEISKKYYDLGIYISNQNIKKLVTDFSNDINLKNKLNEINNIKLYINKLLKK